MNRSLMINSTFVLLVFGLLWVCAGCHVFAKKNQSVWLEFGTRIEIGGTGPTDGDTAKSGIDAQDWTQKPLVDWFVGKKKDNSADEAAPE